MDRRHRHLIHVERTLPLALLCGMLLQLGAAIWWLAEQTSQLEYHSQRLSQVEAQNATDEARGREILIRLTRLEERLITNTQLLQEIRQRQ